MLLCVCLTLSSLYLLFFPPFLSYLSFLPSLIYFAPAGWWSGGGEDGVPSLNPALLALVGSEAWLPRGRLCSGSSTEKRGRERKPGN